MARLIEGFPEARRPRPPQAPHDLRRSLVSAISLNYLPSTTETPVYATTDADFQAINDERYERAAEGAQLLPHASRGDIYFAARVSTMAGAKIA